MLIDRLLRQHGHIVRALDMLEEAACGVPTAEADAMRAARWALARDLLLHLSQMEAAVYVPLTRDPDHAEIAEREISETRALVDHFNVHAARWYGASPQEQQSEHCQALRALAGRVRERIVAEAHFIAVHPLPAVPPPRSAATGSDFARMAWDMRQRLYGDPTPRAG